MAEDPYRAYNFVLDFQGVVAGYFTACHGLSVSVESIPYREGGAGPSVRKLPGQVTCGDVTLSYGLTASRELWDWLMSAVNGRVQRRNVSVILMLADRSGEAARWNFDNAWASKWTGAPLDSRANEIAIEHLTITADSIERA